MTSMTTRPTTSTAASDASTSRETLAGEITSATVPAANTAPLIRHTRQ